MANETLTLKSIGPIKEATVQFGDLTVLVGPQASGKSIFLQFLKLVLDAGTIRQTLHKNGLDWEGRVDDFLELYLGEGMHSVWRPRWSRLSWRNSSVDPGALVLSNGAATAEQAFFIPAQRVLTFSREGWLRPFTDYRHGDPFVVRDFSEKLRVFLETSFGTGYGAGRLPDELRSFADDIFSGFGLVVVKNGPQKRLLLSSSGDKVQLPFMVWSAGQREFIPLLLGLYWLLPPARAKRRKWPHWVIVEEVEMGLHPRGIEGALFLVLDLMRRGYRVCLSTHSTQVLDLVWALRRLRESGADSRQVLRIFDAKASAFNLELARSALKREARVYYFDRESGKARDISNLDPASAVSAEAGWGGLTELSGRLGDIVAEAVADGSGDR